jgi:F420-non-reducing hydrogenase iron-sulfur subunit
VCSSDLNKRAENRVDAIHLMLQDFGIEPERFKLSWISASEGNKFGKLVTDYVEEIKALGPNPFK